MKKRNIIYIIALVVILGICVYSGMVYNKRSYSVFDRQMSSIKDNSNPGEAKMVSTKSNSEDFFVSAKSDREKARATAIDGYNKMIKNPDISQDTRKKCEDALCLINQNVIKEADAELLIKSKGITNVVVFINTDSVTVTVESPKLTSPEISRIKDILSEFVSTKNIKIVEVG